MAGDCNSCVQDARVRDLTLRLERQEERSDTMKDDIKAIKTNQNRMLWAALGAMASSIGTLLLMLLNKS